jgi:hypothetical protein
MNLNERADEVNSRETFLEFVRALAADKGEEDQSEKKSPSSPYGPGAKGWENGSIEKFLDAMQAWASAPANKMRVPEAANWKAFAWILHAGKFYE